MVSRGRSWSVVAIEREVGLGREAAHTACPAQLGCSQLWSVVVSRGQSWSVVVGRGRSWLVNGEWVLEGKRPSQHVEPS